MSIFNAISTTSIRRALGGVAVAAASATVLTAAPAQAAPNMTFEKSSGRIASTEWLEVGTLPGGVPGNIHFGSMWIESSGKGQPSVYGDVIDMTCPDGVIPEGPGGGHDLEKPDHGVEEPDNGCITEGLRFIDGGNLTFTMDRKLTRATLTGTLNVFGHDGPAGSPPVNMTWTGLGDLSKTVEAYSWTDGSYTETSRYNSTGRDAQVSGRIGAMVFDDVAGEYSSAWFGTYRGVYRSRTQ